MAGKLMHAVQYSSYGGGAAGLKHAEVPVPAPKKDEVLIKVEAASINPFDWKIQKGVLRVIRVPGKFPFIPAGDVAGEVVEVGSAVKNFKAGDKVVSMVDPRNMAAGKLMHAVQYGSHGGGPAGLKHVEVPIPSPKADEVLLKVEAVSINPIDWKLQKGMFRPLLPWKFPFVPSTDVAGEVVAVGSGVKNFKAGDKVVSILNPMSGGGLAEFCVAKGCLTVPRPPELSPVEAAGMPSGTLTAHVALTRSGVKLDGSGPQKNILVTAASGGVGHYAVQLAKLGNAHVTATCGARNLELVKSLGADEVLDYKTPDGAALRSPSGRKYDAVIHCTTGIPWSTFEPNLSENGKVIDLTPGVSTMMIFALKKLTCSKKWIVPLLHSPKGETLECLVKLVKDGKLKTVIDSKYPLSKAEDAWAKSIDGQATGKIIVEP